MQDVIFAPVVVGVSKVLHAPVHVVVVGAVILVQKAASFGTQLLVQPKLSVVAFPRLCNTLGSLQPTGSFGLFPSA